MFTLPELPYAYNALEPYIDEETMRVHHGKHHAAYAKNLNDVLSATPDFLKMDIVELLQNLDKVPEGVRAKVRNNGGGHYNHSFFWELMSPKAQHEPAGRLAQAINTEFGSFDGFKEKFAAAAMGRFGSGWAFLVSDGGKLSIVDTPNQDSPVMNGQTVILGIDVWEHAYYLKYKNMRADYITAWWNVVNFGKVGELYGQ